MTNFHLMAKPFGPSCNLNCTYCFYLEKENLFHDTKKTLMSDDVLEAYTKKYILSQSGKEINFAWQGGEPTMAGLDFFRKAVRLQKKYNRGKKITNAIQTNGILIDEEWCRFLVKHKFLVGLSLDGPEIIHDSYRKNKNGGPTFSRVYKTLTMFRRYGVEYNVLTTVNSQNCRQPLQVYNFLKESGVEFIQFIPIVEREADSLSAEQGLKLSGPSAGNNVSLTGWSADPDEYGNFLISIFKEWVRRDVGKVFVMNFEWALSSAINGFSGVCHFAEICGNAGIIEHNGDIYSCDHFVYPEYKIGNILTDNPADVFSSEGQKDFGIDKKKGMNEDCRSCNVVSMCNGGCPKHRFLSDPKGGNPRNYLCRGYKNFFSFLLPYIDLSRKLINEGRPLTELMKLADSSGHLRNKE